MDFFKKLAGLLNPKQEPAPKSTPDPVPTPEPVPAPPVITPAPVVNVAASDKIRVAMDAAMQALVASPEAGAQAIGARLMNLKFAIMDEPSSFKGFDDTIVRAVGQIECYCSSCNGNYTEINMLMDKLEAAVAARNLSEATTERFVPTMQTHFYQLMLMDLGGRLKKLDASIAEKSAWLAHVQTLPMNEQAAHMQAMMTCNGFLTSAQMQRQALNTQISTYQFGLMNAQNMLSYDGALPEFDIVAIFEDINKQMTDFESSLQSTNQAINNYNVLFADQAEQQMLAAAQAAAAKKQQEQQQAEIQRLQQMAAESMAKVTGQIAATIPAAPVAQVQPQAAPVQPAAPANEEMQTL